MWRQGDVLIERVESAGQGEAIPRDPDGAVVLARGEVTGHRHAFYGSPHVAMFRDDALAREMPKDLYIGNIKIEGDGAILKHEEHAEVALPPGDYVVRQQRRHVIKFDEAGVESAAIEVAID